MSDAVEKPQTDFRELVYRGVESDILDYKAPLNWNTMKRAARAKIVRHVVALANTKGGVVVIGVGEDASGHPSVYTGLSDEEVHSFDPSIVGTFINSHVEPPVDFTIERPLIDGKRYAILIVRPFNSIPHVCAHGVEGELQQGVFYIRTSDASSRAAIRAYELHGLIQRALRNQRELLGRMLRGILYDTNQHETPQALFEDESSTTRDYYLHRHPVSRSDMTQARLEITVFPEEYGEERFTFEQLRHAVDNAAATLRGKSFLSADDTKRGYTTNTAFRIMPEDGQRICQLNRSGSLYYSRTLPTPDRLLKATELQQLITRAVNFVSALYLSLGLHREQLDIRLRLNNSDQLQLVQNSRQNHHPVCQISEIRCTLPCTTHELHKNSTTTAHKLFHDLHSRFNPPETDAEDHTPPRKTS